MLLLWNSEVNKFDVSTLIISQVKMFLVKKKSKL